MKVANFVGKKVSVRHTTGSSVFISKGILLDYNDLQWAIDGPSAWVLWPKYLHVTISRDYVEEKGYPMIHIPRY